MSFNRLRLLAWFALLGFASSTAFAKGSKFWNVGVAGGLNISGFGVRTTVPDFAGMIIGPGPSLSVSGSVFQDKLIGFSVVLDYMLLYMSITFQGAPPFTYLSNSLGASAFVNLNRGGGSGHLHNFGLGGAYVSYLTSSGPLGNLSAMPSSQWCLAVQWKYLFEDKDSRYFFFSNRVYAGLPERTPIPTLLGFLVIHFQVGYDF